MIAIIRSIRTQQKIITLAAIVAMGSLAIHMLVPALPMISREFAIDARHTQWTISLYLTGLAAGQLLTGPLADIYGRRPIMLMGMGCYTLAALAGTVAYGFPLLVAARIMQALGGAAGVVAARVMVGDLFKQSEAAGKQATLMAIVMISPAIAPLVGGALVEWSGWRAVMALLTFCGMAAFLVAWKTLPETKHSLPASPHPNEEGQHGAAISGILDRESLSLRTLVRSYVSLFSNRQFLLTVGALAAASSGLYMFLGNSSFLLIQRFGLSPAEAGGCLLSIAGASMAGTRLVAPIERRGDALVAGTAFSLSGAGIFLLLTLAGVEGPWALMAPMTLLGIGAGLAGPAAINNVIFAEKGLAATAASLAGATQMLSSGVAITLLGLLSPVDPLKLALALITSTGIAFTCAKSR